MKGKAGVRLSRPALELGQVCAPTSAEEVYRNHSLENREWASVPQRNEGISAPILMPKAAAGFEEALFLKPHSPLAYEHKVPSHHRFQCVMRDL